MSHYVNDVYLENARQMFVDYLEVEDWEKAACIVADLHFYGFHETALKFDKEKAEAYNQSLANVDESNQVATESTDTSANEQENNEYGTHQ